jgi:hypothetical protein
MPANLIQWLNKLRKDVPKERKERNLFHKSILEDLDNILMCNACNEKHTFTIDGRQSLMADTLYHCKVEKGGCGRNVEFSKIRFNLMKSMEEILHVEQDKKMEVAIEPQTNQNSSKDIQPAKEQFTNSTLMNLIQKLMERMESLEAVIETLREENKSLKQERIAQKDAWNNPERNIIMNEFIITDNGTNNNPYAMLSEEPATYAEAVAIGKFMYETVEREFVDIKSKEIGKKGPSDQRKSI